jgi:hypothetical protein
MYLNEKIVDDKFNLEPKNLGMKEMKSCAAYLRKIPFDDIEKLEYNLTSKSYLNRPQAKWGIQFNFEGIYLLRAVNPTKLSNPENFENKLGYRFYLPKPNELVVIDFTGALLKKSENLNEDATETEFNRIKNFETYGIKILMAFEDSYEIDKSWHFNHTNIYPHEILLILSEKRDDDLDVEMSYLPSHSIYIDDFISCYNDYSSQNSFNNKRIARNSFINYISESPESLITEVWRAYVHHLYEKKGLSLFEDNRREFLIKQEQPETVEFSTKFLHHGIGYKEDYNNKFKKGSLHIFESRFEETVNKLDQRKDLNSVDTLKNFVSDITNILILDERIQELTYNNPYTLQGGTELNYAHIWDDCNVYIPPPQEKYFFDKKIYEEFSLDLNTKNFDKNYLNTIKKIIINRFSTVKSNQKLCKGLDILVIHLGVVEKLMSLLGKDKSNPMLIKEFLDDMITIEANDAYENPCNNTKIILVSGRGPVAGNLPKEISFLNYSILAQYMVEYRLKFFLTQVLYNSRPKI